MSSVSAITVSSPASQTDARTACRRCWRQQYRSALYRTLSARQAVERQPEQRDQQPTLSTAAMLPDSRKPPAAVQPVSLTAATTPPIPLCIELCAGSARLSQALQARGFRVLAIDHSFNRHKSAVASLHCDLASIEGLSQLAFLMEDPALGSLRLSSALRHLAPEPREKPLSPDLVAMGVQTPRPLRSTEHPLGLKQPDNPRTNQGVPSQPGIPNSHGGPWQLLFTWDCVVL